MSFVADDALVGITAPHSRWPFVKTPFYVHTDFPYMSGTPVWAQNFDFIADYEIQCIYPAPYVVFHDMGEGYGYGGDPTNPPLGWRNVGTIPFDFRVNQPHDFTEFHLKQLAADADSGLFAAECEVSCQGVTFLWSRLDQDHGDSTVPDFEKFTTFRIGVGWGVDRVLYSVRYLGLGDLRIAKSYDGGLTWKEAESLRQRGEFPAAWGIPDEAPAPAEGEEEQPSDAPRELNYLEFRLIAGRLIIWTGNNSTPYVFDEARVNSEGGSIITIDYLMIKAYKFVSFAASAHPTKWRRLAVYDSPEIPIGFYSENIDTPYVDPAGIVPAGWTASVDMGVSELFGPIAQYRLIVEGPADGTWRGQQYSDYVAAVRAVNLFWLSETIFPAANPVIVAPEVVRITHVFDPNSLQVESGGEIIFNNNRRRNLPTGEFGTWGEWLRARGQVAVDVAMNRTTPAGVWGPAQTVFAGYGNVRGEVVAENDGSFYRMFLGGRKRQLEHPRFALPWLDGWNVFYAMAYLAQLGGVSIDNMAFAPYVPNVPFGPGSDLGSPEGPAYYLPVGDAGSAITRFSGARLWEVMGKIAYSIGYMLFFDAYSNLQFRKFTMPLGTKRSFYESDRESALLQPGGGLEGCWSVRVEKDMDEVRNTSIVIGVNAFAPRYDPIVFKWDDTDSIYDPLAFNHLGYPAPAVWMDSQFADAYFSYIASLSMYRFLRTPGYQVSLTTYLQPDIFPLDMIGVQSPKLGTYGLRFMVTSVSHEVNKNRGHSIIAARYIPE